MTDNYPYVSTHYFSKNFAPQELAIEEKVLTGKTEWTFQNESEFIYILAGRGSIEVNGLAVPLAKNQLLQLSSYHVHRLVGDTAEPLHYIRLYFSLGLLLLSATNEKAYLHTVKELEQGFPLYDLSTTRAAHLENLCRDLLAEQQLGHQVVNLNITVVSYIVYLCQKEPRIDYAYPENFLGGRALQYLQFHHQDPITVDEVGAALATTTAKIELALQQLTGFSFAQLLNQVRIRNATALMTFPELKITTIGEICGFQSPSNFYKQFQLVHHTTPEVYRQNLKQERQLVGYDDAWDVLYYIQQHCAEDLSLNALSQSLNIEAATLHHLLAEKFQLSFKQLLNFFRVQMARALLRATSFSPFEVQQKVGYHDATTFARNYKKYYHETPRQTKKNQAAQN